MKKLLVLSFIFLSQNALANSSIEAMEKLAIERFPETAQAVHSWASKVACSARAHRSHSNEQAVKKLLMTKINLMDLEKIPAVKSLNGNTKLIYAKEISSMAVLAKNGNFKAVEAKAYAIQDKIENVFPDLKSDLNCLVSR